VVERWLNLSESIPEEWNFKMTNTSFWTPAYRLFKHDEPLTQPEELRDFYVSRDDSPIRSLVSFLEMEDDAGKYLLAGHRGGGKTTELRKLEQRLATDYAVIWVDADSALDRYNISYAEVIVLIGFKILERVTQTGWNLTERLRSELINSLKTVVYQDEVTGAGDIQLPKLFQDIGLALKAGFRQSEIKKIDIKPDLRTMIDRVNAIIKAAETARQQRLLVIVDGLDRRDFGIALEMFSSSLLTELNCHIIYSIPIALRYSPSFRQPMESFQNLDLFNPPVFKCDENTRPTTTSDRVGRRVLASAIEKRLATLGDTYKLLFKSDALDFLCEKSGGVMRDLIRLARIACGVGSRRQVSQVHLAIATEAVREERRTYAILDYYFPELDAVNRTGQLTSNLYRVPGQGEIVVCDELLQHKLVLGYEDPIQGRWFDINPILMDDLKRWRAANAKNHAN
jgi:hypothetical protein